MGSLESVSDRFKGQFQFGFRVIKSRLFGANNERLDLIMDSFNKLSSTQRAAVFGGVFAVIALFVFGAFALYFSQVSRLKSDLSNSFAALHELETLNATYQVADSDFDKLVSTVSRKTRGVRPKPFFEKIANDLGVTIEDLNEERVPLSTDNPLSNKMQQVLVEMRMPKISIPRLMNFLVEVEKADKYLRVQNLKIRGRYGTRLFFDTTVKVRGYEMN